MLVSISLN